MAALQSLSSTPRLQKKIPLCLTHSLFLHTAQAVNVSHFSSSKYTEFPFSLKGACMHAYSPHYSQTAFCTLAINAVKLRKLLGLHLKRKTRDRRYLRAGIFIQELMQCFRILNKQTSKIMRVT